MARTLSLAAVLAAMATFACAQEPPPYVPPPFPTSGSAEFDAWRVGFATRAVNEHRKDPAIVEAVLAPLSPDPTVKRLNESQPEFVRPIWTYIASAVSRGRIEQARALHAEHRAKLAAAERTTGVPSELAIAIWGIESSFGAGKGTMDVPRSLATLAYAGRRTELGERELLAVFDILRSGEARRADLVGSWAGAMGHTQFMPTSFLARAIDGDGDGRRDIWNDADDALASTLNYLKLAGWTAGRPWGFEVQVPAGFDWSLADGTMRPLSAWRALGVTNLRPRAAPDDMSVRLLAPAGAQGAAFLVGGNFDAIRAYNSSDAYALSVALLSDLAGPAGGALPTRWPTDDPPVQRADARELQALLNALGHEVGTVDGQVGPRTRRALQAFQKTMGLTADGWPNQAALASLRATAAARGLSVAVPPAPPAPGAAPSGNAPATSPANSPANSPASGAPPRAGPPATPSGAPVPVRMTWPRTGDAPASGPTAPTPGNPR